MIYVVRTADRMYTDAVYDNFDDMAKDWAVDIMAGFNYFIVMTVDCAKTMGYV